MALSTGSSVSLVAHRRRRSQSVAAPRGLDSSDAASVPSLASLLLRARRSLRCGERWVGTSSAEYGHWASSDRNGDAIQISNSCRGSTDASVSISDLTWLTIHYEHHPKDISIVVARTHTIHGTRRHQHQWQTQQSLRRPRHQKSSRTRRCMSKTSIQRRRSQVSRYDLCPMYCLACTDHGRQSQTSQSFVDSSTRSSLPMARSSISCLLELKACEVRLSLSLVI